MPVPSLTSSCDHPKCLQILPQEGKTAPTRKSLSWRTLVRSQEYSVSWVAGRRSGRVVKSPKEYMTPRLGSTGRKTAENPSHSHSHLRNHGEARQRGACNAASSNEGHRVTPTPVFRTAARCSTGRTFVIGLERARDFTAGVRPCTRRYSFLNGTCLLRLGVVDF